MEVSGVPKEEGPGVPGPEGSKPEGSPDLMALLSLGVYMAVCIGLGLGLGYLVDSKAGTTPAFLFVGLVLGLAAAVLGAYREMKKYL